MLNSARFLQLVLDERKEKTHMLNKVSVSSAFEAQIYFHALALMSGEVEKKKLKIARNEMSSLLTGMTVQLLGNGLEFAYKTSFA